ncbi:MAG: hypothetical protein EOP86_16785 [Verrucomicrobiaceae bacterium]|nr:MAG: hypothetical protein EOP86_16785 [Verrucomicrobiaceae bacterium]
MTTGCFMLVLVACWLLALGVWMIWHVYAQVREMRTFTQSTAQVIHPDQPTGDDLAALRARLTAFGKSIDARTADKLELTVADLNHLLSAQEPVNRLKDIAKVEEITDVVKVKVALALNGVPFSGERLFLNGFMTVRPEIKSDSGLVLLTRSVEVPDKTLPPGFTGSYLQANHLDGLALDEVRKDNRLKSLLTQITSTRCEPGKVVLEYTPPVKPSAPVK